MPPGWLGLSAVVAEAICYERTPPKTVIMQFTETCSSPSVVVCEVIIVVCVLALALGH